MHSFCLTFYSASHVPLCYFVPFVQPIVLASFCYSIPLAQLVVPLVQLIASFLLLDLLLLLFNLSLHSFCSICFASLTRPNVPLLLLDLLSSFCSTYCFAPLLDLLYSSCSTCSTLLVQPLCSSTSLLLPWFFYSTPLVWPLCWGTSLLCLWFCCSLLLLFQIGSPSPCPFSFLQV